MDWRALVAFTILFHAFVYYTQKSWILRLDTKKFNKSINGLSSSRLRKYLRLWFRLGSYVTIAIGFPFTLWLFLRTIFYSLLPPTVILASVVASTASPPVEHVKSIELHREEISPYPDANIPLQQSSDHSSSSYLAIQPILPGWNLPLSHLPYYLIAILISVVIHELGHAIASASHRIPISSVGVSLFGPLIPAAHVELNSGQLKEAGFMKQLDILSAGVWMNMYLSLITYFIIPKLLPFLLFPTHVLGSGLAVTGVVASSGVGGPGGLERGDIIFGVDNCVVHNLDSWLTCLELIWESEPVGLCLDSDRINTFLNSSDNPGCCAPNQDVSPTHLCFLQMSGSNIIEELGPSLNSSVRALHSNHSKDPSPSFCLPAKPVINLNDSLSSKCYGPNYICPLSPNTLQVSAHIENGEKNSEVEKKVLLPNPNTASEGKNDINDKEGIKDMQDKNSQDMEIDNSKKAEIIFESRCHIASLLTTYDSFRIVQIHRRQEEVLEPVLFVGDVWDLRNGVESSDYSPRSWWLSSLLKFRNFCLLPVELETVLLLTAGLSAGLAVVNMLPIYGLDGYHVVEAVVRETMGKKWESRKVNKVVNFISWGALLLALLTILCSILQNT